MKAKIILNRHDLSHAEWEFTTNSPAEIEQNLRAAHRMAPNSLALFIDYDKNENRDDKDRIAKSLCKVLKLTRQYADLVALSYCIDDNNDEWVIPQYYDGEKTYTGYKINVTGDSGWALIQDVIKRI